MNPKAWSAMPFNPLILALLLLACTPLHAKENNALPMDLLELLGELDEEDQASLEEALTDLNATPAKKQPQAAPVGDSQ